MAPLSILLVAICGVAFGRSEAQVAILERTRDLVGPGAANALKLLLANAHRPATGIFATLVALLTLMFGASGVFLELRAALNTIWEAPAGRSSGWRGLLFQRLASFAMVLGLGFFLLLSLVSECRICSRSKVCYRTCAATSCHCGRNLEPPHFAVCSHRPLWARASSWCPTFQSAGAR